jgi:hypothetical protein
MEDPTFLNDRIASLWDFANNYASQIEQNDRFRYLAWLSDPSASQAKKDKINANIAWSDAIFIEYYKRKTDVLNGELANTDFGVLGPPPYSFFEIYTTP